MRRFLGFLTFSCTLPDGESPGIKAAKALYRFSNREETLQAVSGARLRHGHRVQRRLRASRHLAGVTLSW